MATGQALLDQMQRVTVIPSSLAIWGLGQMGIAIKGPDGILYFDPHLTDSVREQLGEFWYRAYDPPLQPNEVNNASAVLSSHEHLDHCDPDTFGPIAVASPNASFVITGWSRDILSGVDIADDRVTVPKAGQAITIPGTSARLTAVPSAHYDYDEDPQKGHRWFGYVIEWNGVTFYHSGDTIIYPGYIDALKAAPPIDIAMLPVNGRDWYREIDANATGNLWPREAVQLAQNMGWSQVIVGHNDMFPNNTITYSEIAGAFEHFAPRQAYKVLQPGELYYFVK